MRRIGIEELKVGAPLAVGDLGVRYAAQIRSKSGKALVAEWLEDGGLIAELTSVADLSARLRHPFLLREWGVLPADGGAWRVSEHIEGAALGELMRDAPIDQPVACEIARKVARALHAAFDRKPRMGEPYGLIHARLGPADVLVGVGGQVKLGGVGRVPNLTSTAEGAVVPTPYMAPELLEGRALHASDVYALGAMLAQMLTGRVPAFASPQADWHDAVSTAVSDRVREVTGQDALAELISWCLAFSADGRPNAVEVENWLDRVRGRMGSVRMAEWCQEHIPSLRDRGREEAQVAAGRVTLPVAQAAKPSPSPSPVAEPVAEPAPPADPPEVEAVADAPLVADVDLPTEEAAIEFVERPTTQVGRAQPPAEDLTETLTGSEPAESTIDLEDHDGPAEDDASVPIIHDAAEHSTPTEDESSEVRVAAIDFIAPSKEGAAAQPPSEDDTSFDDPSDDATDRTKVEAPPEQGATQAEGLDEALGGREWPRPMLVVPDNSPSMDVAHDRRNTALGVEEDEEDDDVSLPPWAWPVLLGVVAIGLVVLLWQPWDVGQVDPVASAPTTEDATAANPSVDVDRATEGDPSAEPAAPDDAPEGDGEALADGTVEDDAGPSQEIAPAAAEAPAASASSASSGSTTTPAAPAATPAAAEPAVASKPVTSTSTPPKPAAAKPAAAKPAAAKPAASKPAAAKPAASKPAASAAASSSSAAASAAYDPWADPTGTPASPPAPVEAAGVGGADIIGAAAVPTTGTVSVKGDAANVQFVGAGQTSGAGTLAPGTYTLMVTFGVGEAPASAGQVTVSAGATTTVTCKSSFRRCSSH